jgi:hypothetical protein
MQAVAEERLYVVSDLYSGEGVAVASQPAEAEQLFQRARAACAAGDVGEALRLAARAASVDPNHAGARRVLGYRRVGEHWAGNYAARRLERGELWSAEFGWIAAADLPRYRAGERPLGNRWITAEEDARRHTTIEKGWRLRTDHFQVATNHSLEEAARLATQLELVFQLWQREFGEFYLKADDLLERFDGRETSGYRSKPFEVTYYRTRAEYNAALVRRQPQIGVTLGIYFDADRSTHFFAGAEQDLGTIVHESVHQFFQESRPAARRVGALANAWLIEGVACYFESLAQHQDDAGRTYYTLGQPGAGRLPAARHRRLVDDFYVPLGELSALGMPDLQRRTDLARLYSQGAGLTTFLMQAQSDRYRPAVIETLQAIYAGRDKPTTLEQSTGVSYDQLDREYAEYLRQLPATGATK